MLVIVQHCDNMYTLFFFFNIGGCFLSPGDNCRNLLLDSGEDCDCGRNFDQTTGVCNNDPCCNGSACRLVNGTQCRLVEL